MCCFFLKKFVLLLLFTAYFLPLNTMHVLSSENVITGRVVLEPVDEQEHEPSRCSLRAVFSRLISALKQCFRKKYDDTRTGRCLAVADAVTTQYVGAFVGAQIAQYALLDPSIMMVLGGLCASLINDYLTGAPDEKLTNSFNSKWGIIYGIGFANIFSGYPFKQAITFLHPRAFDAWGPTIGSIDNLCHFLSDNARLLNALIFVFELDILADFLTSRTIEFKKYITIQQLPKALALFFSGIAGKDPLYALMGEHFLLYVVQGGQILVSLAVLEENNFIHTLSESKFRMIENTIGNARSCPICLEDFEEEKSVALLPCSHVFHESCLLQWSRRCPFDKQVIDLKNDLLIVIFAIPADENNAERADEKRGESLGEEKRLTNVT